MLPYFFHNALNTQQSTFVLDEPTSKHCIQVLRMQQGEQLLLTNGKGLKAVVQIEVPDRKRCGVQVLSTEEVSPPSFTFTLAIAFTKNNSRNEWLLEKVTEMGIGHIIPLITTRTEKDKFNMERCNSILVAAMLQSQQSHLPILHQPISLKKMVEQAALPTQKFIAHCVDGDEKRKYAQRLLPQQDTIVLIGPEGDFTLDEINQCITAGFEPVSLGNTRLRTETAGLYVSTLFNALNYA